MRMILIIMIMLLTFPSVIMAQKLNSRGEKRVAKIELQSYQFRTSEMRKGASYIIKYNEYNQIVGLSVKYKEQEQQITKENDKLIRRYFYDKRNEEKSIKYEYLLDESGNIIRKNYYEGIGDPLVTKEVWDFIYRYDAFSGRSIVDSLSYCFLYRDTQSGMRDYDFADGETEPYTLKVRREPNGLCYQVRYGANSHLSEISDRVEYAAGIYDDTNLNLNFLWNGAPFTIAGDTNDPLEFLIPEWINAKSGYLISEAYQYKYITSKDNKGNIIRIDKVDKINGKMKQTFNISYIE